MESNKNIIYQAWIFAKKRLKCRLKVKNALFGPIYDTVGLKISTNESWNPVNLYIFIKLDIYRI